MRVRASSDQAPQPALSQQERGKATYFHLGLTGHPLGHSLSPKIHAAALQACQLNGEYVLLPVAPGDWQGLQNLLARLRGGALDGLNVTIPHKQSVLPLLDELTPTAQAIGAVNTIYRRGAKLIGANTDAAGFLSDLKKFLAESSVTIPHSALILGAGGAARAVIYALANDGWEIAICARRLEQAQQLAASLPGRRLRILQPATCALPPGLIINATPAGMSPTIETSPLPETMAWHKDGALYDLVYNPRETKLIKNARAQGISATNGLGMLIEQAALAFEIWTGCHPPRDLLRAAAEN